MNDFKPCPFCGGNYICCRWNYMGDGFKYREIHCNDCGATLTKYSPYIEDDNELEELWNQRIYTGDETADYFILPKPKEKLANEYSAIKCDSNGVLRWVCSYEIINDAFNRWQDQIEADMKQKLFEAFRPTCHIDKTNGQEKCSNCGYPLGLNYCTKCGAKVVGNG